MAINKKNELIASEAAFRERIYSGVEAELIERDEAAAIIASIEESPTMTAETLVPSTSISPEITVPTEETRRRLAHAIATFALGEKEETKLQKVADLIEQLQQAAEPCPTPAQFFEELAQKETSWRDFMDMLETALYVRAIKRKGDEKKSLGKYLSERLRANEGTILLHLRQLQIDPHKLPEIHPTLISLIDTALDQRKNRMVIMHEAAKSFLQIYLQNQGRIDVAKKLDLSLDELDRKIGRYGIDLK